MCLVLLVDVISNELWFAAEFSWVKLCVVRRATDMVRCYYSYLHLKDRFSRWVT